MTRNDPPLRLGIIGCGNVTQNRHLPAIQSLPDLRVVALADIDSARLRNAAERYGIQAQYSDYRSLVDDEGVEAVAVCTPLGLHVEMALAALEAGKHVMIEKPLAPSLDAADALLDTATASQCTVMVGYNLRWHRLVRQALDVIRQGRLGRIELMVASFTAGTHYKRDVLEWKKRRALGGGVLMEFATHYFDLWRFLLDTEVSEVHATSRSDEWDDVTGTVTVQFEKGILATAYFSEWTTERNEMHIFGREGSLHLSLYRFDGLEYIPLFSAPGEIRNRLSRIALSLRDVPRATAHFRRGGDYYASFIGQWQHFAQAIRGSEQVECTPNDGRRALQIALAAAESASTGEPVRVENAPREISPVQPGPTMGA
jgi:predicted dehydrogenase